MARKKATQEDQEEIVASDVQEEAESDIKVESIVVPVSQGDINEQQSILQIAKEKLANGVSVPEMTLMEQFVLLRHEQGLI